MSSITIDKKTNNNDNNNQTTTTTATNNKYSYATLITFDDFYMGLQTMIFTLKQTSTNFPIIILVTNQVSIKTIQNIEQLSSPSMPVNVLKVDAIPNPNQKVHIKGW